MKKEQTQLKRENVNPFTYAVVRKISTNEIMEVHKIDNKTNKKEITFEHPIYKKLKQKLKISV
jgi:hypothetical protein